MPEPADTRVLVVDDSALDRALLRLHLTKEGYRPDFATNGTEALFMLDRAPDHYDVVLLDRRMPDVDGLTVLAQMKEHPKLRMIPVILETAATEPREVIEGIRTGAWYYLTKPYDAQMLLSVVAAAANDYAEFKELRTRLRQGLKTLRLLHNAVFSIRTVDEARDVATILANACPDPDSAVVGLTELLLNAVEHGNLGITYEEKSAMRDKDEWQKEVDRRLALPENQSKRVEIRFERDGAAVRFTIRDDGHGFDWNRFLDIDPSRAFDTHGRGIAMARRLSFSSLDYHGVGNEVVATVRAAT
ncbi:MAG TPA: response regulator [Thermoanaerobaculia bacterium]|nr:response regulator [Thermoanaerobaculia bacterium]